MSLHNDQLQHNKMVESTKRLEHRLRQREDEYICYKQFHILVGTFNVNNRQAPSNTSLREWIYRSILNNEKQYCAPDIIAVGFQEIDTSGGAYIYDDKKKEDEWEQLIRKTIQSCYKSTDAEKDKFELLNRVRLMGILLFVYVRASHLPKCTLSSRASVPTGFMGIAGNKGGVGIRFRFYDTDICFINSHFASGDGQTHRRNDDYQTIESRMSFTDGPAYSFKDYIWYTPTAASSDAPNQNPSLTPSRWWKIADHDIIFWCGDMNYRISQPNEQVRKAITEVSTVPLLEKDQLRCEMKLNKVFTNYYEPSIDFMPTYKFDPNTDTYDTSEKLRTPSWTDRILYQAKRVKVQNDAKEEIDVIKTLDYISAKTIQFSDHRPVSGLYLVVIKYECDEKRSNRIREELIRELDREENDSIPTIEVRPRPPEIVFNRIRYLDKPNYVLYIKNTGECPCTCAIWPSSMFGPMGTSRRPIKLQRPEEFFFDCLLFTPNSPYNISVGHEQTVEITFSMKTQYAWSFGKQLNEILILHVENGADTFITLDVTLDMGPFGLPFEEFPVTLYDSERKQYVHANDSDRPLVEMKNDPPTLYIALVDCLKERNDINLLYVFNNETQDALDLIPLRDQIYEYNYKFDQYSSAELFMMLLHLLQSLPEPLISREIQDGIFANRTTFASNLPSGSSIQHHVPNEHHSSQPDMTKAVSILIEQLKTKERNLFFRFLLVVQKSWPTTEQIQTTSEAREAIKVAIDVLALALLHDHADRNQRHAFLLACLNEEKKYSK